MKTKTINLYEFDELDDVAKDKAVDDNRCINVDHWCWWHAVCDDAKMIGLDITDFDEFLKALLEEYRIILTNGIIS